MLAGFIVWLARQRIPPARRWHYHHAVDEYLQWELAHPRTENPSSAYFAQLLMADTGENRLRVVREALARLAQYHDERRRDRGDV